MKARDAGNTADRVGIILRSESLDYDMWIPIREYNEDTAPSLLHRFETLNSYKNGSLYGTPFSVQVSCFDARRLQNDIMANPHSLLEGHGRRVKGGGPNIDHNIIEEGLIRINNNGDNFCLFHAIETARLNAITPTKERWRFTRYRTNQHHQKKTVRKLMKEAEIPLDLAIYDARTHIPAIQNYFDLKYPGQFRILVFRKIGKFAPVFSTGASTNIYPLCIYHEEQKFDAIYKITTFFGIRNYCFSCCAPFNKKEDHMASCKALCLNCREIGPEFPCTSDGLLDGGCIECYKTFKNIECFNRHITNGVCSKFERCVKCSVIWNKAKNTNGKRTGHVCEERFCKKACFGFHDPKAGCFVQKVSIEGRKINKAKKRKVADESENSDQELTIDEIEINNSGVETSYRIM